MKKNNIKESLIKFKDFIITPPNPKENIFQYIMRYFLLTDSRGNPSWTITILAYVLVLVGFVCYKEFQLAGMYNLTFSEKINSVFSKVKEIMFKIVPYRDNSDIMTDYFDVSYYYNFHIGKWDKPYVQK
jgi:hypothetical protein